MEVKEEVKMEVMHFVQDDRIRKWRNSLLKKNIQNIK